MVSTEGHSVNDDDNEILVALDIVMLYYERSVLDPVYQKLNYHSPCTVE